MRHWISLQSSRQAIAHYAGSIEREVLRELARQLIRREEYSLGSKSVVMPYASENSSRKMPMSRPGQVIVVGGAVMDATFHTKDIPPRGTSTEAYAFGLAPGGKGLWQAVAAARLGLDVALVAAVADDRFGREIVNYLQGRGSRYISAEAGQMMRIPHLRASLSSSWATASLLIGRITGRCTLTFVTSTGLVSTLPSCDAVLMTFEIPRETLQYTLALVNSLDEPRPIVIVTPGQPYPDTGISGQALSQIDYLVAHALGTRPLCASGSASRLISMSPLDSCWRTASRHSAFLRWWMHCLLRTTWHVQCARPSHPHTERSSVARDAFCAALAAKLIDSETTIFGRSCSVGNGRNGRSNCRSSACRTQCLIVGVWNSF